jgi:lipopolysaccharide/colanic/teichoic acid biosynthesis glycosyltransferase
VDVALALLGIVLALPLLAFIALAIKLTSKGPVIFTQERAGLNGRPFRMLKFRSMVVDAEKRLNDVIRIDLLAEPVYKLENDPRVTRFGRFLRRFSVDELPQLLNVLRGDMSLVGPRPALPEEVSQYVRKQRRRLSMRPGLTCLWVVEGRDTVDFETWMTLDMRYIDNWSLALDWKIILRTIPQVVIGRGAH